MNTDRDQLEILASDFMEQLRRGESPSIDKYAESNPDFAEEILELFPTIAATEQLKVQKSRTGGFSKSDSPINARLSKGKKNIYALMPSEGITLGKYEIQERIGQGSLGTVWRSHHPDLNLPIAIKILHPIHDQKEECTRRFLREAQTAAKLNHSHIVRVYDAGVEQNLRYLVMEYVERGSVADLLKMTKGPLPISQACEIATAVADALITVEEAGIVHRDIKPDNILIDKKGIPKLADLGLVSATSDDEQEGLTTTGIGLGTPLYVSPEQAMGDVEVDIRADIYSLGITLYHMVTGVPPFSGATPYQIVHHHMKNPLKDPRKQNPAISEELSNVIFKMLEKKTSDRYQTAIELKVDLERVSTGLKPLSRFSRPTILSNMRLRWIAIAIVLSFVVITLSIGINKWLNQELLSKNEISDKALTEQARNGKINLKDWQVLDQPIRQGVIPRPLRNNEYKFNNGVLEIFKTQKHRPIELFYGPATISGDFSLSIEGKNILECNIINPFRKFEKYRILLRDQNAPYLGGDLLWQTIEIRRDSGKTTCKINGSDAFNGQGTQGYSGRVSIIFSSGVTGELRKFELLQNNKDNSVPHRSNRPLPRHL